ncbi:MAG: hypothetical protein GQ564_16895 [Bacteroidales bacterium]|nr:hypothetical protein [Bacteroidales bacterium]
MKLFRLKKVNNPIKMNYFIFAILSALLILLSMSCVNYMPSHKGKITNYTGEDNDSLYWKYYWTCKADGWSFSAYSKQVICGMKFGEKHIQTNGNYKIPGALFLSSPFNSNQRINGHASLCAKNSEQNILSFTGINKDLQLLNSDLFKSEIEINWDPELITKIQAVLNEYKISLNEETSLSLNYKYSIDIEGYTIELSKNSITEVQNKLKSNRLLINEYVILPTGYTKNIQVDISVFLSAKNEYKNIHTNIFEKQYELTKQQHTKNKKRIYIDASLFNTFTKQALNYLAVDDFKDAIYNDNLSRVKELLSKGFTDGIPGESLLDIAIEKNKYNIAKLLIDKGFSISCNPKDNKTSIHKLLDDLSYIKMNNKLTNAEWANQPNFEGRKELEQLLYTIPLSAACINIKAPADQFAVRHPMYTAMQLSLWDFVEKMLQNDSEPNFLETASAVGNIRIYKLLLAHGANFSKASENSLCIASANGHYDLVNYLLAQKAEISEKTLETACKSGNDLIAKLIFDSYKAQYTDFSKQLIDLNLLQIAIKNKTTEKIIKYLLANGASFNEDDISTAIIYGNFVAIKVFLENKPTTVDDNFIYYAVQNGNIEILNYLINKGFNINNAYYANSNAIFKAADDGRIDLVKILLNNNAQMHVGSEDSGDLLNSILLHAKTKKSSNNDKQMLFKRSEIIVALQLAQQKGAKLNWDTYFFKLPNSEKALMLLESIENINNYAKEEWQAVLTIGAKEGAVEFLKIFIKNGVTLNDTIDGNFTLKQVLEKYNHQEVIPILNN